MFRLITRPRIPIISRYHLRYLSTPTLRDEFEKALNNQKNQHQHDRNDIYRLEDEGDDFLNDSPAEAISVCIKEARAEASWKSFMEARENPLELERLSKQLLFDLMNTIATFGIMNSETSRRVALIANHIRSFDKLTEHDYEIMLMSLGKARAFDSCMDLMDDLQNANIPISQRSFEDVVYRFIAARRVEEGLKLSSQYRERGLESTESLYVAIMSGFTRIRDFRSAESTLDAKIKAGYPMTAADCGRFIRGYSRMNDMDSAEKWVSKMMEVQNALTLELTTVLVNAYARFDLTKAQEWFKEYEKLDVENKHENACCSLIYAHCKLGNIDDGVALLRQMHDKGPEPSEVAYNIIMDGFIKRNKFYISNDIFEEMKRHGIRPDVYSYSIILNGLVKTKQIQRAIDLLEEMKDNDIAPNIVTYGTLIDGYSKNGQLDAALELYDQCKASGMSLENHVCNSLMHGTAAYGRYDETFRIYKDMQNADLEMDAYTYSALIYGFSRRGEFESAKILFEQMKTKNLPMTVYPYNSLLAGLVLNCDVKSAYTVLAEMRQNKIVPNINTYNILMQLSSHEGRVDNILKFVNIMIRDEGIEIIDTKTICNVMMLLSKHERIEEMKNTFKAMEFAEDNNKVVLESSSWVAFINGLCKNKCFEDAKDAIVEMLDRGVIPPEWQLTETFQMFKDEGRWDDVEAIIDQLEQYSQTMGHSKEIAKKQKEQEESDVYISRVFNQMTK